MWIDIYLAQAESVGVTQRWLDWELTQDEPDPFICNALADLLKSEMRFLASLERKANEK